MNENGLAAALTFLYPHIRKPGLNAGMLTRYILEKCATTEEAIDALKNLPIASAQTITLADRNGKIAVVECNPAKLEVIRPEPGTHFVAAANCFHSETMKEYRTPSDVDSWRAEERYETARNALAEHEKGYAFKRHRQALRQVFRPVLIVVPAHRIQRSNRPQLVQNFRLIDVPAVENAVASTHNAQHLRP